MDNGERFQKGSRMTLKNWAMSQIKEAILAGRLEPGDRLIEARLAKEMDISRFPIREAISALEQEGMVITIPFKGTYVAKFDQQDIEELFKIRSALEELAVRTLVKKQSTDKIKKLDSVFLNMVNAVRKEKKDLVNEDLQFHEKICELSGNRRLLGIWMTLRDQLTTVFKIEQYSIKNANYFNQTLANHRHILDAIKKGDCLLAQKRIRDNIHNGLKNMIRIMQEKKKIAKFDSTTLGQNSTKPMIPDNDLPEF